MIEKIWKSLDRISLWRPALVKAVYIILNFAAVYRFFYYTITSNPRPPFWFIWKFDLPVVPGSPMPWMGWTFVLVVTILFELYGFKGARQGDEIDPTRFSLFWAAFFIRMGLMFARW